MEYKNYDDEIYDLILHIIKKGNELNHNFYIESSEKPSSENWFLYRNVIKCNLCNLKITAYNKSIYIKEKIHPIHILNPDGSIPLPSCYDKVDILNFIILYTLKIVKDNTGHQLYIEDDKKDCPIYLKCKTCEVEFCINETLYYGSNDNTIVIYNEDKWGDFLELDDFYEIDIELSKVKNFSSLDSFYEYVKDIINNSYINLILPCNDCIIRGILK